MLPDYYSQLRNKWDTEKRELLSQRAKDDLARVAYFANYYLARNGNSEQQGYRAQQDQQRKNIRTTIDAALQQYRSDRDRNKLTWRAHYDALSVSRAERDTASLTKHKENVIAMWDIWLDYRTAVNTYNLSYHPSLIEPRAQIDKQRTERFAVQQQTAKVYWEEYWSDFKIYEIEYWRANFNAPVIENTAEQIAEDNVVQDNPNIDTENYPVNTHPTNFTETTTSANGDLHPTEQLLGYYERKRIERSLADVARNSFRDESTRQIKIGRENFDSDYAANSTWNKYHARVKNVRTQKDLDVSRYNMFAIIDFCDRADRYWRATTKIRSEYNTSTRIYRLQMQRDEMLNRGTYAAHIAPVLAERVVFDTNRAASRNATRRARNVNWSEDIKDQKAWVTNYYSDMRIVRQEQDTAKQEQRTVKDAEFAQNSINYLQTLDTYIANFFGIREDRYIQQLSTLNSKWNISRAQRQNNRNNSITARQTDRDNYDQARNSSQIAEYARYDQDIQRLCELGYNQYARNKSASRAVRKSWRSVNSSLLNGQRASYDFASATVFNGKYYSFEAVYVLHAGFSWSYHKITGGAYYLNIIHRNVTYPMFAGSYGMAVHLKRMGSDAATYTSRYMLQDRAHDLAALLHHMYLPMAWRSSNFLKVARWNIADAALGTVRYMHQFSAYTTIAIYRNYVPVRQIFSNLLFDTINNAYALGSYGFFPLRYGSEFIIKFLIEVARFIGVNIYRIARDLGQMIYILGCNTVLPLRRVLTDVTRKTLHLVQDGLIGTARFSQDRMHDIFEALKITTRFLAVVCKKIFNALQIAGNFMLELLTHAAILLKNALYKTGVIVLNAIGYFCHYALSLLRLAYMPAGVALGNTARGMEYYLAEMCVITARFIKDRSHDIGRPLLQVGIPIAECSNYLGIAMPYGTHYVGKIVWRTGSDYVSYPLTFVLSRGVDYSTRAAWDLGVFTSRSTQDSCTTAIRKLHDISNELHQHMDRPALCFSRAVYDMSVSASHSLEFVAKKSYDTVSALSPLHLLERGGDRVLREHAAQQQAAANEAVPTSGAGLTMG